MARLDCVVCFEAFEPFDGICADHPACRSCLTQWTRECYNTRRIPDMPCVHAPCQKTTHSVALFAALHGDELAQAFLDRCAWMTVSAMGTLLSCAQCTALLFLDRDTLAAGCTELGCPGCGARMCAACQRLAHPGDCAQHALDSETKATETFLQTFTKKCVSCSFPIIKNGGCNQMACTQCKKVFCWMCGLDFTAGHDHSKCYSNMTAEEAELRQALRQRLQAESTERRRRKDTEAYVLGRLERASKTIAQLRRTPHSTSHDSLAEGDLAGLFA